jgi:hypothetical protein
MKQDRNMLAEHGTELMVLKPSSVLATALEDLKRRDRNAHDSGAPDKYEHYAFHRKHVKKAVDARDLIARAVAEPGLGIASAKYNTRLLYGNSELLKLAMETG